MRKPLFNTRLMLMVSLVCSVTVFAQANKTDTTFNILVNQNDTSLTASTDSFVQAAASVPGQQKSLQSDSITPSNESVDSEKGVVSDTVAHGVNNGQYVAHPPDTQDAVPIDETLQTVTPPANMAGSGDTASVFMNGSDSGGGSMRETDLPVNHEAQKVTGEKIDRKEVAGTTVADTAPAVPVTQKGGPVSNENQVVDSSGMVIHAENGVIPPHAADSGKVVAVVDTAEKQKSTVSVPRKDEIVPATDTLMKLLFDNFTLPVVALSLDEAINCLLRHNPVIISTRLEWLANERKAQAAWGAFEPSVTGGYTYSDTRYHYRPFPEKNLESAIELKGTFLSGAEYSIGYRLTDIRHGRSTFDTPQAFSGITATQPLLRGAWFGSPLASQKIARMERNIAYHAYRSKIIEIISETENAYWNTAFAQEKYRFALKSLEISRKVVTDSKMRLKTGKMSPMDCMEADAGLAARQANLADAAQGYLDAANQLKLLLSTDTVENEVLLFCTANIFVENTDTLTTGVSDSLFTKNFTMHPEYQIRQISLEKEKIILGFHKDKCLPELNAKGSYGLNGFGNRASTALYRLLNEPQPAWSAEIEMTLPVLANVEARNLLAAQKLSKEAADKNLSAMEYQIVNSYRIIKQRISALGVHAGSAGMVVDYRERLLEEEFKKIDAGKSNNRLIYEIEEKLSEARQWQLESNVSYRMALVQQARISGSLLRDLGLETIESGRPVLSGLLSRKKG